MKKIKCLIWLFLYCIFINNIKAQIVFTYSNTTLTAGQIIGFNKTSYIAPGASGINQVWDYSSVNTISTFSLSIMTTTNSAYSYSNATNFTVNDTLNNKFYCYSFFNDSSISFFDTKFANDCISNYHLTFKYPFSYGDSISKTIYCGVYNDCAGTSGGTQTYKVKFDGFGTLKLPSITLNNISRIGYFSNMDVHCNSSTAAAGATVYCYYLPNTNYPVAQSIDKHQPRFYNPPIITKEFIYQNSTSLGIKEGEAPSLVSLYPNPTTEYLYIQLNKVYKEINYNIKDIYGNNIFASQISTNETQAKIDVSILKNGTYFIEMECDKNKVTKKFIVLR